MGSSRADSSSSSSSPVKAPSPSSSSGSAPYSLEASINKRHFDSMGSSGGESSSGVKAPSASSSSGSAPCSLEMDATTISSIKRVISTKKAKRKSEPNSSLAAANSSQLPPLLPRPTPTAIVMIMPRQTVLNPEAMEFTPQASRALIIRGLPSTADSLVMHALETWGPVRAYQRCAGCIVVHYFDIRHAVSAVAYIANRHSIWSPSVVPQKSAQQLLEHTEEKRPYEPVKFELENVGFIVDQQQQQQQQQQQTAPPDPAPAQGIDRDASRVLFYPHRIIWAQFYPEGLLALDGNNGTLVVYNVDHSVAHNEILAVFRAYGEVLNIARSKFKSTAYVEYFDIRDANKAFRSMNGVRVWGSTLHIRYSRRYRTGSGWTPFPSPRPAYFPYGYSQQQYRYPQQYCQRPSNLLREPWHTFSLTECKRTTLMLRNIPNKYDQQMLLDELDEHCLNYSNEENPSAYDFVYIPIDYTHASMSNLGYAFVNFTSVEATRRLYRDYHNRCWRACSSPKICKIVYARLQGRATLEQHFRTRLMLRRGYQYMPVAFNPPRTGTNKVIPEALYRTSPVPLLLLNDDHRQQQNQNQNQNQNQLQLQEDTTQSEESLTGSSGFSPSSSSSSGCSPSGTSGCSPSGSSGFSPSSSPSSSSSCSSCSSGCSSPSSS